MSGENWTPGPWQPHMGADNKPCCCRQVWSRHPQRADGGFMVAEIYFDNGRGDLVEVATCDNEEAEANARLISAAPDLYAALVAAQDLIAPENVQERAMIRAALAKARGEVQP